MEQAAAQKGRSIWDIADFYTKAFFEDLQKLNIKTPHTICKATDHIAEQIALIKTLEEKGFTYRTSDGLYFDTSRLKDYGKLTGQKSEELKAGARVSVGEKRLPTDFALWKFSPKEKQGKWNGKVPGGSVFPAGT